MRMKAYTKIFINYAKYSYPLFIGLFLCWFLFTMDFSIANALLGFTICSILSTITYSIVYSTNYNKSNMPTVLKMIPYFFRLIFEIYKASFSFIITIIMNDNNPVVTVVDLDVNEPLSKALIANSITLTPGTITLDSNNNKLYVLSIKDDKKDGAEIRKKIKTYFERFFIQ